MDSAWSDKALKLDHNHGINNGKMVDLTLKLGQPVSEDDCPSGYQGNEYKQGTKWSRGMSDIIKNKQKVTNPNSDISRKRSTNYKMDITKAYSDGNSNNMVSAEFVVGIPSHHHPSNYHFHGSFSHIPAAGGSLPPSHNIHYTYNCNKICKEDNALLPPPPPPPPPENVDKGKSSSKRGIDSGKRCMNIACSTIDTPMWRKGPLGPKTLCNACGIRYRKEKDQRKAREAGIYNYINTRGCFK